MVFNLDIFIMMHLEIKNWTFSLRNSACWLKIVSLGSWVFTSVGLKFWLFSVKIFYLWDKIPPFSVFSLEFLEVGSFKLKCEGKYRFSVSLSILNKNLQKFIWERRILSFALTSSLWICSWIYWLYLWSSLLIF